ncbi:MAG: hypothetical protein V5A42_04360, partial [Halofilum sp. (in: g-proteobacteria)]
SLANRAVDPHDICESHRELVESICAGDADRAGRLGEANVTYLSESASTEGASAERTSGR